MQSFFVDDLEFPVLDLGDRTGDPVILLHGFPQDAHCWDRVAESLAGQGMRVLVPFQRGYSESARPRRVGRYRLRWLAGDVLHLMDAASLPRAHVVGHDWGGGVAWYLADTHPERITSLTVVSTPHPRALSRSLLTTKQAFLSWYLLFFQIPRLPEWLVLRRGGRLGVAWLRKLGLDLGTATEYVRRFSRDPASLKGALNWYRALLLDSGYGVTARPVAVRTLYVRGADDPVVGAKAARYTEKWVTGRYTGRTLPDAGHWIPEQQPMELVRLLVRHIRGGSGADA